MSADDEKKELKSSCKDGIMPPVVECTSPAAMLAIWLENLGDELNREHAAIIVEADYRMLTDGRHLLEHIKTVDAKGEKHWRRKKR